MILARRPLAAEAGGHDVLIVNLVDRYALVRVVQYLVVQIGVGVALRSQHLLDAGVAPARPAVRGKHDLGF